ncbi:zinc-ribbon domain-containing protein [Clostridium cavendishii DSM 21758]|uniref:Zinc-ribbon domain-containing protein n=1 Tax=Clostridium cavendishii DSM 21758 TaxID=1121302 RepID=A0A1M6D5A8_9CLOT|nr:zinc ribbon domain-containing protein [Clostridium cavendishii]SHI68389.1 zinc-ribbon domain-containing protein [Clostridium cavendishii DSM 21758]
MSFSSRSSGSSNRNHYRNGNNGSKHYQKKGLLGNLFDMIGSRSYSSRNKNNYRKQYNNTPMYNEPIAPQGTISCSKCRAQIPAGSKFCLQCGQKVRDILCCRINNGTKSIFGKVVRA